jgi:hypothetical protein
MNNFGNEIDFDFLSNYGRLERCQPDQLEHGYQFAYPILQSSVNLCLKSYVETNRVFVVQKTKQESVKNLLEENHLYSEVLLDSKDLFLSFDNHDVLKNLK